MNGYTLLAESYRKAAAEGKIAEEEAEKNIRVYEFLATCDLYDKCIMVDSSAFNDIIRGYLQMALLNAELDEKSQKKALEQLRWIFDECSAKEVLEKYKKS